MSLLRLRVLLAMLGWFFLVVVYEAMSAELELKEDKKVIVNIFVAAIIALAITLISASLIKSSTNSIVDSLNTLDSLWR